MHVVYEAGNLIDAHLVRHALEHAGIPVYLRGEALLGNIGEIPACDMVAVCVPKPRWSEAHALVVRWLLSSGHSAAAALRPCSSGVE